MVIQAVWITSHILFWMGMGVLCEHGMSIPKKPNNIAYSLLDGHGRGEKRQCQEDGGVQKKSNVFFLD